jgi:uncharacterized protein
LGNNVGVAPTLDQLRRYAIARSLAAPTTLKQAMDRLGFVQADPIRAPARAQDLTLRHRVRGYRAGDLERRFGALGIEEDFFVNYGFVTRRLHALMHPRVDASGWSRARRANAASVLEFVRERGEVHPREVDDHFAHGTVVNYWGGSSSATTHLLEHMHYRGLLRVVRRDKGIRVYAVRDLSNLPPVSLSPDERVDALVDAAVHTYAPVPGRSLSVLVHRLRYGVPQWRRRIKPALERARRRLAHVRVDGLDWFWPPGEDPSAAAADGQVRLLAPFDPIVWDRARFELLWGWAYRFEAYTPVARRKLGYYALPLLSADRVIGWSNLSVVSGQLHAVTGYVAGSPPRPRAFRNAFLEELDRMRLFLRLAGEAQLASARLPGGDDLR